MEIREYVSLLCGKWKVWKIKEGCVGGCDDGAIGKLDTDAIVDWHFVGAMAVWKKQEVAGATRVSDRVECCGGEIYSVSIVTRRYFAATVKSTPTPSCFAMEPLMLLVQVASILCPVAGLSHLMLV
jgi:hypothetical protein